MSFSSFRLLSLGTVLLFSQCKRADAPQPLTATLPPVTQAGLNTIGFRVDGTVWLPKGSFNFPAYKAHYSGHTFWISSNRLVDGELTSFGIFIRPVAGTGSYDLQERSGIGAHYSTADDMYNVLQPSAGSVQITRLDSVQRIVAGTFAGTLVSPTSGKTINITEGRFDLSY
ncbi:MAG: hypothetical protein EOO63_14140 [Hymenobacter sp.]|nr:MAG: hypothetical protein EOO63_14140 [Hymenobacter sp.]